MRQRMRIKTWHNIPNLFINQPVSTANKQIPVYSFIAHINSISYGIQNS